MTNLTKQCALVLAVLVCVAAVPFHSVTASESSPQAGAFASAMLDVGKSRWEREGRTSVDEFALAERSIQPAIAALVPQGPGSGGQSTGGSPGGTGGPTPIETMSGATHCPVEHTQCPAEATVCPIASTNCPVQATVCNVTECPVIATHCPSESTTCETTKCPENATFCPTVATSCPAIPTACPVGATTCPAVTTACPVVTTTCPNTDTLCQNVATQCPLDRTTCPFSPTTCDTSSTQCDADICYICVITYNAGPQVWFEPPTALAISEQPAQLMVVGSPAPVRTFL